MNRTIPSVVASPEVYSYKLETVVHLTHVIETAYENGTSGPQTQTQWNKQKELGSGGYGIVTLQEAEGGRLRAVKEIHLGRNINYSRELNALCALVDRKDLFVPFFGWYEDSGFLYIVMEYAPDGDLDKYLKTPNASLDAKSITRQLLEGIVVLHERRFTHRDLKPSNILITCLDPIRIKIADFGVCKNEALSKAHTQVGSVGYMAPEITVNYQSWSVYTNATDMWSLGCVLHKILTLEIPFAEGTRTESEISGCLAWPLETDRLAMSCFIDFCTGKIKFPCNSLYKAEVGNAAISLVKSLMVVDPISRISAKKALESPWLRGECLAASLSISEVDTDFGSTMRGLPRPGTVDKVLVSKSQKPAVIKNPLSLQKGRLSRKKEERGLR